MKWYDVLQQNKEIARLDDPQWDKRRKVHEWRNHVPEVLRENWKALTSETRVAVYLMAQKQADAEEWD